MKLKKAVLTLLTPVLIFVPEQIAAAADKNPKCKELWNNHYSTVEAPVSSFECRIIQTRVNTQGILTLKQMDNNADWDIYVTNGFDKASGTDEIDELLNYTNNNGNADEIVFLPFGQAKYYGVFLQPKVNNSSNACLSFHAIDPVEIAGRATGETAIQKSFEWLVKIMFGQPQTQQERANLDRSINLGYSVLQRENMGSLGYDVMLNEIKIQLANAFGGGSLMFDFGFNYFKAYLEEAGKFLYEENARCTTITVD